MSARSQMTHRATVERDVGAGVDSYNLPVSHYEVLHPGDFPCYAQIRRDRLISDQDKVLSVATAMLLIPLGADLQELDIVTRVQDRRGRDVFQDKMKVQVIVPKETHSEVTLEIYR